MTYAMVYAENGDIIGTPWVTRCGRKEARDVRIQAPRSSTRDRPAPIRERSPRRPNEPTVEVLGDHVAQRPLV
jgi:hypothetical protein